MSRRAFPILIAIAAVVLGGCDLFDRYFGSPPKPPLPGERIAVLAEESRLLADPRLANLAVAVPAPVENEAWALPGGVAGHAMHALAGGGFTVAWQASIGAGSSRDGRVTAPPVIAGGKLFAMDAQSTVTALDAATGSRLWSFDVEPKEDSGGAGGGVAVAGDRVYVGTGYAQVLALEAATGKEIWRTAVSGPLRAGPTVGGGRVFAISIDNQVHALDAATGRKIWSHAGITETAGLYGTSTPALDGNIAVATFSSGEIFALRVDNGRVLWGDSLSAVVRTDAIAALADVRGLPVVERGVVYAVSHGGRMAAIDLRSGGRIWEQNVGSLYMPWVAGDFIFVISVEGELVCLTRADGRVRWTRQLDRWTEPERKRGRIVWTNPVLVAGMLFLTNSRGDAVAVSPEDGEIVQRIRLPDSATLSPVVANRTIYVLTDNADVVALR